MQSEPPRPLPLPELLASLGVPVETTTLATLRAYVTLLFEANRQVNLTRITDPHEAETRLLADSLALIPSLPQGTRRLIDLGSGGGVPGLPIAIACPDIQVTLVDATGKKVLFLSETAEEMGLNNVVAIKGRAEELARDTSHRERYDALTARAVARLVTLAELSLPFLRVGGKAILPKGSAAEEELTEAQYAIRMCGGRAQPLVASGIEGTQVIVLDKVKPTPAQFPRRTGVPNKTPLLGPQS
jgi:16S rRNA (guanine527-N7)-methyltransferase